MSSSFATSTQNTAMSSATTGTVSIGKCITVTILFFTFFIWKQIAFGTTFIALAAGLAVFAASRQRAENSDLSQQLIVDASTLPGHNDYYVSDHEPLEMDGTIHTDNFDVNKFHSVSTATSTTTSSSSTTTTTPPPTTTTTAATTSTTTTVTTTTTTRSPPTTTIKRSTTTLAYVLPITVRSARPRSRTGRRKYVRRRKLTTTTTSQPAQYVDPQSAEISGEISVSTPEYPFNLRTYNFVKNPSARVYQPNLSSGWPFDNAAVSRMRNRQQREHSQSYVTNVLNDPMPIVTVANNFGPSPLQIFADQPPESYFQATDDSTLPTPFLLTLLTTTDSIQKKVNDTTTVVVSLNKDRRSIPPISDASTFGNNYLTNFMSGASTTSLLMALALLLFVAILLVVAIFIQRRHFATKLRQRTNHCVVPVQLALPNVDNSSPTDFPIGGLDSRQINVTPDDMALQAVDNNFYLGSSTESSPTFEPTSHLSASVLQGFHFDEDKCTCDMVKSLTTMSNNYQGSQKASSSLRNSLPMPLHHY